MLNKQNVTIYDIARLAGTSPRTVTRAFQKNAPINEATRQRILEIAAEVGYRPNSAASRIRGRELVIGILYTNLIDVFTSELMHGFKDAENQLKNLKVRVIYHQCSNSAEASEKIIELINNGADGIIHQIPFHISDYASALLNSKHIPCISVSLSNEFIPSLSSISVDTVMKGRLSCSMISLLCPGGRVAVFTGDQCTQHHISTLNGFLSEATLCGIDVCNVYDTKDNPLLAEAQAHELLKTSNCDGIVFTSANSCTAINVLQNSGRKFQIVGADIFPQMSDYILNGTVAATIYQNPKKQSRLALINMYHYLAENAKLPSEISITPQIILKCNLQAYINNLNDTI